jgi:hypothetical protein
VVFQMRNSLSRGAVVGLLIALTGLVAPLAVAKEGKFLLMESLRSKGNPSLTEFGFSYLPIIYPRKDLSFEGDDMNNMVTKESVVRAAKSLSDADMVCIDIEHWATCNTCRHRQRSLDRYLQVLEWFRNANSKPKLGYWGRPPKHKYLAAIKKRESPDYREWVKWNDFYKPLAKKVDVIFPSLYTEYDDVQGWVKHAEENLAQARRYGKPVYAFLMPYYVRSNESYSKEPLPADFWKRQLETVYENADGLVIWDGPLRKWDPTAPWWKVTKEFLKAKGLMP